MANNIVKDSKPSLIKSMAGRYGVDADKLLDILKSTAFKQAGDVEISNEQLAALLIVAEQYNLNPFTREIYAFPDKKNGGVIPVVGVDGWSRITNEHKHFDGVRFYYSDELVSPNGSKVKCPVWIDCEMYRKDRANPTIVREYLDECYRAPFSGTNKYGKEYTVTGPWQSHPKRMMRHKAFIQCARIALGFTGIYDEDEAHNIIDMGSVVQVEAKADTSKMDEVVTALVDRSKKIGNWSAANQYLMANFSGPDFTYASNKLKEAQAALIKSESKISASDNQEVNNSDEPLADTGVNDLDNASEGNSHEGMSVDPEMEAAFNEADDHSEPLFQ